MWYISEVNHVYGIYLRLTMYMVYICRSNKCIKYLNFIAYIEKTTKPNIQYLQKYIKICLPNN